MTDVAGQKSGASSSAAIEPLGRGPEYHTAEQRFILQVIQPGLVGLMDGSVSTLAPLFATAFLLKSATSAFVVGLAAAVGAGISMAFSEGMSDTGELTGRGRPVTRGAITGLMTCVGGIGHTLPFLIVIYHIASFQVALSFAYVVVGVELVAIAFVRYRFFKMNFFLSIVQVVFGGALVFASGVLIGSRG